MTRAYGPITVCGRVTGPITARQSYRANHGTAEFGLQGQSRCAAGLQGQSRGVVGLQGQSRHGRVTGPITARQGLGYRANHGARRSYTANHGVAAARKSALIMALQGQDRVGRDMPASVSPHEKWGRVLE